VREFTELLAALAASDPSMGGYEDYRGNPSLREELATLDREIGIEANPASGMLITSGAQQAITLVARALGPSARVAVENPCFPGARIAFQNAGAEVFPASSCEDGLYSATLEDLAAPGRFEALYCCPTYSNPRGRSWSVTARLRVLEASRLGGFLILEDDYLGDLDYLGERLPRLASLSAEVPGSRVLRIRTFSKCLLPALRLAEVSGEASVISRLLAQKVSDDIGSSAMMQRALAAFIRDGRYRTHLERVRPRYRATREALRSALSAVGPASGIRFDDPPAGLSLVATLPGDLDAARFFAECGARGVTVASGNDYWLGANPPEPCFRLGFGHLSPEEVRQAVSVFPEAAARAREFSVGRSFV